MNGIDFDYIEYARQRFEQYWLRKPELLGPFETNPDGVNDGNSTQSWVDYIVVSY